MPGGLPDTGITCAYWTKSAPLTRLAQSPWPLTRPGPGAVQASAQKKVKKNREIAEPSGIKTS